MNTGYRSVIDISDFNDCVWIVNREFNIDFNEILGLGVGISRNKKYMENTIGVFIRIIINTTTWSRRDLIKPTALLMVIADHDHVKIYMEWMSVYSPETIRTHVLRLRYFVIIFILIILILILILIITIIIIIIIILLNFILFYFILFYFILFYNFILFYFNLLYFILFYFILCRKFCEIGLEYLFELTASKTQITNERYIYCKRK